MFGCRVEIGAYNHVILAWPAGYEPQTVAMTAGWIRCPRMVEEQR